MSTTGDEPGSLQGCLTVNVMTQLSRYAKAMVLVCSAYWCLTPVECLLPSHCLFYRGFWHRAGSVLLSRLIGLEGVIGSTGELARHQVTAGLTQRISCLKERR